MSSTNKSFQFTILPSPNYTVGAQSSVFTDIIITDLGSTPPPPPPPPADPQPTKKPTVNVLLGSAYNRVDSFGNTYQYHTIVVTLDKPYLSSTTVEFTVAGSAVEGQDYRALSRSVTFPINETSVSILLEPTSNYNPATPPIQKQTVLISGDNEGIGHSEDITFPAYTVSRTNSTGSLSFNVAIDLLGFPNPVGMNIPTSITFNPGETTKYITGYLPRQNYGGANFEFTVIPNQYVDAAGVARVHIIQTDYVEPSYD